MCATFLFTRAILSCHATPLLMIGSQVWACCGVHRRRVQHGHARMGAARDARGRHAHQREMPSRRLTRRTPLSFPTRTRARRNHICRSGCSACFPPKYPDLVMTTGPIFLPLASSLPMLAADALGSHTSNILLLVVGGRALVGKVHTRILKAFDPSAPPARRI